jgi:putative hydrolase of the HAD superfamily
MTSVKAILFDFGGTLFDYKILENAERECLAEFVHQLGIETSEETVHKAYRNALGRVFMEYLPKKFYFHRDLFKDALAEMLGELGVENDASYYERYRKRQWELHKRDFQLRDGVVRTLSLIGQRDIHLGIVSNIDEDQLAHLLDLSGIAPYFDDILSSEKTRSCKPDQEIFSQALSRAGCPADEVLFVGDTPLQDIAGANRAGMKSVLIQTRDYGKVADALLKPDYVIQEIPELLELV